MALDKLTKIDGGGISTTSNYRVGIITATKFIGPIEGTITSSDATFTGNVTIGGTLTYEDVTNVDSVGIITAQKDIHVGAGVSVVGIVTAATFKGDGDFVDIDVDGHTNLDNVSVAGVTTFASSIYVADSIIHQGDTDTKIEFATNDIRITAANKLRIHHAANGLNYFNGNNISQATSTHTKLAGSDYVHRFRDEEGDDTLIQFFNTNVKNTVLEWNAFGNTTAAGNLIFRDINTGKTEYARFTGTGSFNIAKDLDVDGHTNLDNVSVAGVTTFSGNVNITNTNPKLFFYDTNNDSDYAIVNNGGVFRINDETNSLNRFSIDSNGNVSILKDLDVDGHTNLDNVSVAGVSTFSGVVQVPNGSAAAPAIHFGDSDSGVYGDSSNGVRLTAGGSDTIVATTNGVTFPPQATALTSLTLGSQSALSKPLYFADAASVQSASILLDNSSQELRIKNGRFSGQITLTTYNVERLRITSTGAIQFNGTNSADNTNKLVYLTTPSYDTDEEPFGFIHSGTYNNQNLLYLGGGMTSSYNACTLMKFYTTPSVNTIVGTERLCIESWGGIQNNQGAIYGGGAANEPVVHFNGAGPSNDLERGHLAVSHNAAYNASPIARISLVTRYNSSGGYTFMGGIEGGKANTTDNNFDGFVRLMVRKHGQGNIEGLRITSSGTVNIGGDVTSTTSRLRINSTSYPETTEYLAVFKAGVANGNRFKNRYIKIRNNYTGSVHGGVPIVWESNADGSNNKAYGAVVTEGNGDIRFLNAAATSEKAIGTDLLSTISEKLRIASDGKVRIGAGTPQLALLHISPTLYGINLQNDSNNKSRILFSKNSAGNDSRAWIEGNGELNGYIALAAGDSERLRIDSSGNVSIGGGNNTIPRKLWVYEASNDPYIRIQRGGTSDVNLGGIEFASSNGNGNNVIGTIYGRATGNSATTGIVILKARDSSSGSNLNEPLRAMGKSSSGCNLMSQGNAVCVFGRHHETGGTDATADAPTYNVVYEHSSSSYRTSGNGAFGGTFVVGGNASTWYPVWFSLPTHQDPQILSVHKYVHNYATWDGKLLFRASLMGTGYGAFAVQHRIHFFSYSYKQFVGKAIYTGHNNAYLVLWMLGGGRSYQWGTIGARGITVNVGDDGNNHNLGPGNTSEGPITSAVTIPVGYEKDMSTSGTHQQTGFS